MKLFLLPLFLLSVALSAGAQLTNLTFAWDVSTNATGYRFYELQGTNRIFLGATSNLTFVVTNWNVSTSRTVAVTATNILAESALSVPLVVPPAPAPVQNLKVVPLSILTPIPGVVEMSQDLVDWNQRIRIAPGTNQTNALVTWVQYLKEPVMFLRSKTSTPSSPPIP